MRHLTAADIAIFTQRSKESFSEKRECEHTCLGASFYFATELLKRAVSNKPASEELHQDEHLIIMDEMIKKQYLRFYGFSLHIQNLFVKGIYKDLNFSQNLQKVVNLLNLQEAFIANKRLVKSNSRTEMRPSNKLGYTLMNGKQVLAEINALFEDRTKFENTAFIMTTCLKGDENKKEIYLHSTVVINYEKSIYFFDNNMGVFIVPLSDDEPFLCYYLLLTLAIIFETDEPYKLSPEAVHIRVHIDTPMHNQSLLGE